MNERIIWTGYAWAIRTDTGFRVDEQGFPKVWTGVAPFNRNTVRVKITVEETP